VRVALALATVLVALAAGAEARGAGPPRECAGLQVCIPVTGPWVAVSPAHSSVRYQLACPLPRYLIGGTAADVSALSVAVSFLGRVGSPVGPGITTASAAVFVGMQTGAGPSSFRPHLGCIPASGGGARSATMVHQVPPGFPAGQPLDELAVNVPLRAGASRSFRAACPQSERLVGATNAFAFFSDAPPRAEQLGAVQARTALRNGVARVSVRAGSAIAGTRTELQVLLDCARGA
jgi:hypothetical protein